MALDKATREALKHNPPPPYRVVRARAIEYGKRAGMRPEELGAEIGYAHSTMRHYFRGTYADLARASVGNLGRALTDYMDANPVAGETGIPEKLFRDRDANLILECAGEARARRRVIALEGAPGTGKTAVLRWYAAQHGGAEGAAVYLRIPSIVTPKELLAELARAIGAWSRGANGPVLRNVVRRLRHHPRVLLLDESQHLLNHSCAPFEALRDVIDLADCGAVLAAHYSFLRQLTNGLAREREWWLRRIKLRRHLGGLEEQDALPFFSFLGLEAPRELLPDILRAITARDRAAFERARLTEKAARLKFLSKGRAVALAERVAELREIPGNHGKPLAAIIRAACALMVRPEGRAL